MIRLSNMHKRSIKRRIFYFHTLDDCNKFINVLKENSCNVNWGEPMVIPDDAKIKTWDRHQMDVDPTERAEKALSWAIEMTNDPFSFFIP